MYNIIKCDKHLYVTALNTCTYLHLIDLELHQAILKWVFQCWKDGLFIKMQIFSKSLLHEIWLVLFIAGKNGGLVTDFLTLQLHSAIKYESWFIFD